jgi:hypothetical protein
LGREIAVEKMVSDRFWCSSDPLDLRVQALLQLLHSLRQSGTPSFEKTTTVRNEMEREIVVEKMVGSRFWCPNLPLDPRVQASDF